MSDTKSNEAPQPQPSKTEWWRAAIPLAVLLILWFCPLPDGLSAKGMHMFAIFAATIVSILTAPLPTGAIMFIALTVAYFTGTLTLKEDLAGFSSGTVWLIFSAYILSLGFVKSGLGKRIAYFMLSKFGGSSTGIAYSLGLADLIMASAMPSVTARGGGIIMPVARSICRVMGSEPGESGKKIGDYLMMTCFQVTPITGGLFMTGMAANLLAVQLAKDQLGIQLTWGGVDARRLRALRRRVPHSPLVHEAPHPPDDESHAGSEGARERNARGAWTALHAGEEGRGGLHPRAPWLGHRDPHGLQRERDRYRCGRVPDGHKGP